MRQWLKTDCIVSRRENLRPESRLQTLLPRVESTVGAAASIPPSALYLHILSFPSCLSTGNGQSFILMLSTLRSSLGALERVRTKASRDKCRGIRSGETWWLSAAISDGGGR